MKYILATIFQIVYLLIYGVYTFVQVLFRKIIPRSKKSLDGEVFLITGSASGIGREVALHLAKNHVKTKLVLWDWNEEQNKEIIETTKFFGAQVFGYKVDVTNRIEVAQTAKQVAEDVGEVTILFNNAGIVEFGDIFTQTPEQVEKTIQVNLISHFWTLKAFLPSMILRNHGHIVTTSSGGGWAGLRYNGPYSASKFAIRGYLESLRSELRHHPLKPKNVMFTTVYPGLVRTQMTERSRFKIRFQSLVQVVLEPRYVAENIVEAICQNQETLFIPRIQEPILRLKSIIPQRFVDHVEDFMVEHLSYVDKNVEDKQ